MGHRAAEVIDPGEPPPPPPSLFRRLVRKAWWLHSGFALSFGVGVMLFARSGLAHADKVLMALMVSWAPATLMPASSSCVNSRSTGTFRASANWLTVTSAIQFPLTRS